MFDAYVNMLRTQTETMSAAIAGVDSITVSPYDDVFKTPDEFSERIARNQQLLLKEVVPRSRRQRRFRRRGECRRGAASRQRVEFGA